MKKILVLVMVFMLVGCGKGKETTAVLYEEDCTTLVKEINLGYGKFKIGILGNSIYRVKFINNETLASFPKGYCVILETTREDS